MDLVWSDDEDDDPRRYIPHYPKAKRLSREVEALHDERLRAYRSASDTSTIINGGIGRLTDHKRSFFSGIVKTNRKDSQIEDKNIQHLENNLSNSMHNTAAWLENIHPDIIHYLGKALIKDLWQRALSFKAVDVETNLIAANLVPQLIQWLGNQRTATIDASNLNKFSTHITQNWEKDDYLLFSTFLECMVQFKVVSSMKYEVDFETRHKQALKLESCCCGQPSCSHCNSTAVGILHEDLLTTLIRPLSEREDEEERRLTRGEIFRLKVAYGRQQVSHPHNKFYARDIIPIMVASGLKADEERLFADGWSVCQHLLLPSFEVAVKLAQALVYRHETVHLSKQLEKLLVYRLPHWLQSEFSAAEILLYQHHFHLIDRDGGGSIDAEELRALLINFSGRNVPLSEAEGILKAYDIDGGGTLDFTEFLILIYRIQRGTVEQAGDSLLEALLEAKRQLGLFEQIQNTAEEPPECIYIRSFGGNPILVEVTVTIPDVISSTGRPCALSGLSVAVEVLLKDGFPFRCPELRFPKPVIAPHLLRGTDGACRCPHLSSNWTPDWSLSSLLEHVVNLLTRPREERLWQMLPRPWLDICSAWQRKLTWLRNTEVDDEDDDGVADEIIFSETELINNADKVKEEEIGDPGLIENDPKKAPKTSAEEPSNEKSAPQLILKEKRKLYTMQELSEAPTLAAINKLTRLEIYHMQTLLLYLQDGEDGGMDGYYANYVRTLTATLTAEG